MLGNMIPRREGFFTPTTDRFARMIGRMAEFEDLFKPFVTEDAGWLTEVPYFVPTADVVETKNAFEIKVDLPGMKPEEVHVEMKEGNLWITGTRNEEKEEKGKTFHRVERRHGEFRRVMALPDVDGDKVAANYDNGVLKITAPKKEAAKSKHIEVKA